MNSTQSKLELGLKGIVAIAIVGSLGGCGKSGTPITHPVPPLPTTNPAVVAKDAYVCSGNFWSVLVFAANANGPANTLWTYSPFGNVSPHGAAGGVGGDASGNLYVSFGSYVGSEVGVFAPGSTNPARIITPPTGAYIGGAMAVDAHGEIFVEVTTALGQEIFVYGPTASGTATPIRTIGGSLSQIENPIQFALDSAGNLYAVMATNNSAGPPALLMYPAGASGNVVPTLITSSQYAPYAVALDAEDNIYIISIGTATSPSAAAIYEFAAGSKAGAAPIRTIAGSKVEPLGTKYGTLYFQSIQVDAGGNIFVLGPGDPTGSYGNPSIYVWGATAAGNVAPASTIQTPDIQAEPCFYVK